MLSTILAGALATVPPRNTPMWTLNFSESGPAYPCLRTTQALALDNLKVFAKKSPKVKFGYQWLNDHGERVLRSTIQGPGKKMDSVFFTYSEKFCTDRWAAYYLKPLWGYDERYVTHVTAKGVIPPRLKWNGEPMPDAP